MMTDAQVSWSERLELDPLDEDLARVEQQLMQELVGRDRFLDEVTSYLASAGGKQLRPILTMCGAYAGQCGTTIAPAPEAAIVAAAAVEMLHLGSLYHDDVLDEATLRRGVPSVNARWDNMIAVIGGDILLARAINLTAGLGPTEASLLARTLEAVCAGQADELMFIYDARRDEVAYQRAIAGKTAALMAASLKFGGLASALDCRDAEQISILGYELGMAFQLIDDLLDLEESTTVTGKPAGADLLKGIYTLPVIIELQTNARLRELLGSPLSATEVEEARQLVVAGAGLVTTANRAREHVNRSLAILGKSNLHPVAGRALTRLGELIFEPLQPGESKRNSLTIPGERINGTGEADGDVMTAQAVPRAKWRTDRPSHIGGG